LLPSSALAWAAARSSPASDTVNFHGRASSIAGSGQPDLNVVIEGKKERIMIWGQKVLDHEQSEQQRRA
jgi:hypothetical protein